MTEAPAQFPVANKSRWYENCDIGGGVVTATAAVVVVVVLIGLVLVVVVIVGYNRIIEQLRLLVGSTSQEVGLLIDAQIDTSASASSAHEIPIDKRNTIPDCSGVTLHCTIVSLAFGKTIQATSGIDVFHAPTMTSGGKRTVTLKALGPGPAFATVT